ncbi:hypothetical protein BDY19DRAFT_918945 [Irpex rosettiformis]|uniref:Uncharacterized protein n=1 Tax=Irpex rosettiformis TaxID=378272 RepID=A0ACB8UHK4_9APHY|nr:hypothetical protein BDY19DRAFT_918945 [Irpex rosettiformis]
MSASDDLEMQSIRAEEGSGEIALVERHSQQISSITTLNDTEAYVPQPLAEDKPYIAITAGGVNTNDAQVGYDQAPITPSPMSTIGPRTSPKPRDIVENAKTGFGGSEKSSSPNAESAAAEIQMVQVVGQSTGWAAMADDIKKYDEDKIKECRDDIDTLMTFAGLFSAAITAFLVQSYQALLPSKADETLEVLRFIAQQNLISNGQNSSLNHAFLSTSDPSNTSDALVLVNILWFASLISSLVAASFSMLVKHWLREYLAVNNPSAQARLRVRRYREPSLTVWMVFEIAAALPFLLQLALALFFAGLCIFTTSVHTTVGRTTTALVCAWAFCFLVVTILPAFFPRCPYKTAFLSQFLKWIHNSLPPDLKAHNYLSEKRLIKDTSNDLKILTDVDALQGDDELLGTTILESIGQFHRPTLPRLVEFLQQILNHRCQVVRAQAQAADVPWPVNSDLGSLTDRGKKAIRDIIGKYVFCDEALDTDQRPGVSKDDEPIDQICAFLLSPNLQPLSNACIQLIRKRLNNHTAKVFTALMRQLNNRSIQQREWHNIIFDTLRYIRHILDFEFANMFHYLLTAMEAYHALLRPNSPQMHAIYSWIEALPMEGISATGEFLCDSIKAELVQKDTRTTKRAKGHLDSIQRATQCALYLKQFLGARGSDSATILPMKTGISSLLAATLLTEDQGLAAVIFTAFLQQKDEFYGQEFVHMLEETRIQLVAAARLNEALHNYRKFIRSPFLPRNTTTLNRYLKLCFIAIHLSEAHSSGAKTIVSTHHELLASLSEILSQCLAVHDTLSPQLIGLSLHRSCLSRMKSKGIVCHELTETLQGIDRALLSAPSTVPAAVSVNPKDSEPSPKPFHYTKNLNRSQSINPVQQAVRRFRRGTVENVGSGEIVVHPSPTTPQAPNSSAAS